MHRKDRRNQRVAVKSVGHEGDHVSQLIVRRLKVKATEGNCSWKEML